jgi:hypothetical protein
MSGFLGLTEGHRGCAVARPIFEPNTFLTQAQSVTTTTTSQVHAV